jgi:hypothetical protein
LPIKKDENNIDKTYRELLTKKALLTEIIKILCWIKLEKLANIALAVSLFDSLDDLLFKAIDWVVEVDEINPPANTVNNHPFF